MMRENPPNHCRGETENGKESGFGRRHRRRNNISSVDADSDQQDGIRKAERGESDIGGFQRSKRESLSALVTTTMDSPLGICE